MGKRIGGTGCGEYRQFGVDVDAVGGVCGAGCGMEGKVRYLRWEGKRE